MSPTSTVPINDLFSVPKYSSAVRVNKQELVLTSLTGDDVLILCSQFVSAVN